ncbi:hypothetical protein GW17_00043718 [Ensete ventricosum]|nr:hypothetical protein GW17_00043718 [Ensete ventricosum]
MVQIESGTQSRLGSGRDPMNWVLFTDVLGAVRRGLPPGRRSRPLSRQLSDGQTAEASRNCVCVCVCWVGGVRLGVGSEEGTRAERMGEEECSEEDILLYQGATAPLPNGIPTYTVQILNACPTGCSVADIHVRCGWFSSARLINPLVFRRLRFDDCLVNDGAALASGESLSFQYANTYRHPLSVSSVACR